MPLIMLFASYPMSLYFKQDLITTALIMSMFSATYYIFYPNLFKKNLIKLGVKNSQNVIGQNSLELRDEYLIAHQPDTETKVEWRSILKVDETSNHLFLYLKEGSVFIVPLAQINAFEKSELINFLSVKKDILLNVLN